SAANAASTYADTYTTDTSGNYTLTDNAGLNSTWTVGGGTLNYARTAGGGWGSSVFLLNPSVASTAGQTLFTVSGDFKGAAAAPADGRYYQPGLILSGDTTNGGFVLMEFENGQYQGHLVLLRETGGQLTGDEGGTG